MFISEALASSDVVHHDGPFHANPEFWVAVAFLLVMFLLSRPVVRFIKGATNSRAEEIRKKIDEAHTLKEEALTFLNDYKERFRNADKESEAIIEKAKISVEKYRQEAMEDINVALAHKEENFALHIAAMERDASNEIKTAAIEFSVTAVKNVLSEKMTKEAKEVLFNNAINELPEILSKKAS